MIAKWVTRLPWDSITKIAEKMKIDPLLIGAIVSVESAGDSCATRFESHYKWLVNPEKFADLNNISHDTEVNCQKTSYGLMQIMGANARAYGFEDNLTLLIDSETGLKYGIKHLTILIDKYDNIQDAISAYNQGSPRKKESGEYANQNYVDKIFKRHRYLKEI